MEQGRFRVGLRVDDVAGAAAFYRGLGFNEVGTVPGDDGNALMTILEREGALLIVDALEGLPFPDSERERLIKSGPRGLGVAIGLGVDDLQTAYDYCRGAGCEITCEPMDEAWGDRVFECIDPYGYVWEISMPVTDVSTDDALRAVQQNWSQA
jgi:uncharacterized glyoxalase superfamily protein PhnB